MTQTIGNPLSWGARILGHAGQDVGLVVKELGGDHATPPAIREIGVADIRAALRLGMADFAALRTDVIVVCVLYPIAGACLIWAAFHGNLLHLVFPLLSGFALIGPAAALGLYEMSRRREAGQPTGWGDAFAVMQSPQFGAVVALALAHLVLYFLWIMIAYAIYLATLGPELPSSVSAFVSAVLTTGPGWAMVAIGVPVGFVFACLVLCTSVVSFPLLLDRHAGLAIAVTTSFRVARKNPRIVALWGMIVVAGLTLGALPALLGLAVVLPVLGHATWHLYRRAVVPA